MADNDDIVRPVPNEALVITVYATVGSAGFAIADVALTIIESLVEFEKQLVCNYHSSHLGRHAL